MEILDINEILKRLLRCFMGLVLTKTAETEKCFSYPELEYAQRILALGLVGTVFPERFFQRFTAFP